jgi:hypothetical protein
VVGAPATNRRRRPRQPHGAARERAAPRRCG